MVQVLLLMRRKGRLRREGLSPPSMLISSRDRQRPLRRPWPEGTLPIPGPEASGAAERPALTPACASSPASCSSGSRGVFQSSGSLSSAAGLTSGEWRGECGKGGEEEEEARSFLYCHPRLPHRTGSRGGRRWRPASGWRRPRPTFSLCGCSGSLAPAPHWAVCVLDFLCDFLFSLL